MDRKNISEGDVHSACEIIKGKGKTPTIEKVRIILKSGSNTTISKYLNSWKNDGVDVKKIVKSKSYLEGWNDAIRFSARVLKSSLK